MLSQRAKYALKAMIALAAERGPKPLSVTDIAKRAKVPRAFLEQILSDLKRRNPEWGLRKVEDFAAAGEEHGFSLVETRAMPANNLMLLFRLTGSQRT